MSFRKSDFISHVHLRSLNKQQRHHVFSAQAVGEGNCTSFVLGPDVMELLRQSHDTTSKPLRLGCDEVRDFGFPVNWKRRNVSCRCKRSAFVTRSYLHDLELGQHLATVQLRSSPSRLLQ